MTTMEFGLNLIAVLILSGVGGFVAMATAAWVRDWWTR
jgi:hypothetical protein